MINLTRWFFIVIAAICIIMMIIYHIGNKDYSIYGFLAIINYLTATNLKEK